MVLLICGGGYPGWSAGAVTPALRVEVLGRCGFALDRYGFEDVLRNGMWAVPYGG